MTKGKSNLASVNKLFMQMSVESAKICSMENYEEP